MSVTISAGACPGVREDPGRLQLLVLVLRDPTGQRLQQEPSRRRSLRGDPSEGRAGPPGDRPDGHQSRLYRDREAGYTLPRLIREAGRIEGLERLRLSSVEVNHVSEDLIAAMRETPAVSPHLHVPLQSGDDRVLAAMGRRYTASGYLRRVERAEGFNLTTDVIVGFPHEDETAFERTIAVVQHAGITKVHVFPTRLGPVPGPPPKTQFRPRPSVTGARACGPPPTKLASLVGAGRSGRATSSSSTARVEGMATTIHHGCRRAGG